MKRTMKVYIAVLSTFFAQMAFAQCDDTNLTAWDDVREDVAGQMDVVSPGMNSTTCKLEVSSTSNSSDRARVQDQSPACESSFRSRFFVNADALGNLANNERNKLHNVQCITADTGGAVTCTGIGIMQFRLQGDNGNNILRSWVSDENQPDLRNRFDVPLAAGDNSIEFQWIRATSPGASDGVFRGWWNNTTEASPDVEITNLDNYNYCVTQANLGIIKATNAWTATKSGVKVAIDEYESRRQTGIGVN